MLVFLIAIRVEEFPVVVVIREIIFLVYFNELIFLRKKNLIKKL